MGMPIWLKRYWSDDLATSAVEYALIACLLAVIALSMLSRTGVQLDDTFETIVNRIH
ncbi:Flp family type IVb pilin [Rhodoblastus acidophilus]|uniref:Flp family type IVb pilin n=2 Tax=Rhodoblastus acidophilus TaxID=1074 RepID=A0A6N8DIH7_RHOAC|nr:Flp family type IVb pilin [Rhodoblastus acidophilus]